MAKTLLKKNIFSLILIIIFTTTFTLRAQVNASRYAANSVLASGNWYKIKITSTGIYKLTYNDLRSMGISNPAKAKVYGYGGWVLDENFTNPYVDDLPQVAVWMSNTPANFGSNDYILFYARSDIKWEYDTSRGEFVQTQNPYSSDSYYFVTESDEDTKLMQNASLLQSAGTVVDTYRDYYLHEKELANVCESGKVFYGESFLNLRTQTFAIPLTGITTDPALFNINFIARSRVTTSLKVAINGTSQDYTIPLTDYGTDSYTKAKAIDRNIQLTNATENNTLTLTHTVGDIEDQNVHLNYFRVNYTRKLKPYGAVTSFRSTQQSNALTYNISEASSSVRVFDVTDPLLPTVVNTTSSGTTLSFTASNSSIKEYVMADVSKSIPTPTLVGKISNQNLHALEVKDMVILVQPALQKYAEQIKEIHENEDGLQSLIVNPDVIYNEFSSGKPDATAIRRFMKMFYDRAGSEDEKPKYLLLFGDGTYDNRFVISANNWTESNKKSMLLTYQSENSLSETDSYTMDDYFGFLDDKDGLSLNKDDVDLGIGRLPVRTDAEASEVVNKIKNYIADKDKSIWKNNISIVADDAVAAGKSIAMEKVHMKDSEGFAKDICAKFPAFIVNRIYTDMYERVTTPSGVRYPDAKKAYMDKIKSGTLLLNYTGHGSSRDWSHEYILTNSDLESLSNTRLPLIITATCDYGRFDGNITAGSELFLTKTGGGAIALITSSRVVYSPQNANLNKQLLDHIFEKKDGKPSRLGDIIRHSKNGVTDTNKLRYILLGDPALRLSYPGDTYNVKVDEVNGISASDPGIQLRALSSNTIKGRIVDSSGDVAPDFSGVLETIIFDSEQDLKTRGNVSDGTGNTEAMLDYTDYTNIIYTGKVQIENGEFVIEFITPKDILYLDKGGKMSFYAYDNDSENQAQGAFTNYIVGGVDPDAEEEFDSPVIHQIYMNRPDFKSGDAVNSTPFFFAEVSDDSGINLSSAIGHSISLLIDGYKSEILTSYFESSGSSNKRGTVKFPMTDLSEGKHSLQFKVWDIWNNSATEDLEFEVVSNYKPVIYNFIIEGNPAKESTNFKLLTDLSGSKVFVEFEVYSMTGAKQWSTEVQGTVGMNTIFESNWNLITSSGAKLNPGIYICRATVSVDGEVSTSKSEKLIVLGE